MKKTMAWIMAAAMCLTATGLRQHGFLHCFYCRFHCCQYC